MENLNNTHPYLFLIPGAFMKAYMYFQISGAVSWHEQQSWHSTQLVINVCGSFGSFWPDSKLKMAQLALNRISLQNLQRQAMG